MTTKEYTKAIQKIVGVSVDGIWGKNTAKAVLEALRAAQLSEGTASAETTKDEPEVVVDPDPVVGRWSDLYECDAVDSEVHRKCQQVLNVFETGTPEGDYSSVEVYKDGGGGKYRQLTVGRSCCTQDGHLDALLADYLKTATVATPAYEVIKAHYPTKGKLEYATDKELIKALKDAGKEPAMQAAQDRLFEEKYFNPAYKWFHENGFTLPLSMLVIYDSFIHSGGILAFLRKRFSECPPAKGGDEKKWVQSYVNARKSWLANHSNKILRNTVYRMNTMQGCIDKCNWDLSKPIDAHGTTIS